MVQGDKLLQEILLLQLVKFPRLRRLASTLRFGSVQLNSIHDHMTLSKVDYSSGLNCHLVL